MDDPSKVILIGLLILATGQLFVPAAIIIGLLKGRPNSWLDWFLRLLASGCFVLFAFVATPWHIFGFYVRYLLVVAYLASIVSAYRRTTPRIFAVGEGIVAWVRTAALVLVAFVFGPPNVLVFSAFRHPGNPVDLAFPLRQGVYEIGHGGSSKILNQHHDSEHPESAQQYALDIGKLNLAGTRAWGLYPRFVERYAIFGDTVVSPCSGRVRSAVDGLPDLVPPNSDREHLAGNSIVVECKGVEVLLAHLKQGSVRVAAGDSIQEGQPIAQVGNSGNTTEPHLHIHATRDGRGIPILFEGQFLVRNNLVFSR